MALILGIWTTHTCNSDHTQSGLKVSIQCRVLYSGPQRPPISLSPEFKWDLEHFSLVSTLWKVIKVRCTYTRHPSAPIGWAITYWNHFSVCKNCWDTRHMLGTAGTAGTIGTLNMTWASNMTIASHPWLVDLPLGSEFRSWAIGAFRKVIPTILSCRDFRSVPSLLHHFSISSLTPRL